MKPFNVKLAEIKRFSSNFPFHKSREDDQGYPVCTSGGEAMQCPCKENFAGEFCDQCAEGYFNFPECTRE